MYHSYMWWTDDPFPCKFSRIENTVFIQFPHLRDQLQQGPVVASWTNHQEDAQEALKGKRIPLFSFYPSCLFAGGGCLLSCIHISGTWQDLLQCDWIAQWQFTAHSHLCSKPLHEPFNRSISTREEELGMGKVSIITPSASLLFAGLTRQLLDSLNENWSRCWSSGISGQIFITYFAKQTFQLPRTLNPEVGGNKCFLQFMSDRGTDCYFQSK